MRNILLLLLIFAVSGCMVGNFKNRERMYGNESISNICENDPTLCEEEY